MKNSIKSLSFAILLSLIVGLVVYQVTKTSVLQTEVKVEAELVNQEPQQEEAKAAEDVKSDSTVKEISSADNKGTKVLATIKKSKAKSVSAHKKQQQKIEIARRGKPTYQPLPLIPSELRYEALKTQAKARFFIAANGEVTKVEFVKAANEPKLNHLLEKSLRKWKFESGTISFVQDINVTFRVE